jgi:hypothetical protein
MRGLFKLHRRISVPNSRGPNIGGIKLWTLSLATDGDICAPLSALGVLFHTPAILNPATVMVRYSIFNEAYQIRTPGFFFNKSMLSERLGLREISTPSSTVDNPEMALASTFEKVLRRKVDAPGCFFNTRVSVKNAAFILFLQRPQDNYQHAITIECGGLWDKKEGYGFQDTVYTALTVERHSRKFRTVQEFHNGFADYLRQHGYVGATIQAVFLESI